MWCGETLENRQNTKIVAFAPVLIHEQYAPTRSNLPEVVCFDITLWHRANGFMELTSRIAWSAISVHVSMVSANERTRYISNEIMISVNEPIVLNTRVYSTKKWNSHRRMKAIHVYDIVEWWHQAITWSNFDFCNLWDPAEHIQMASQEIYQVA